MTSVNALVDQLSSLDINKAKAQQQQPPRQPPTKQAAQPNVAKLLTKFAAPNPYAASSSTTTPTTTANPPLKPGISRQATAPPPADPAIDIGRYDGGFEIDDEKRGEKVYGEAAADLALDSSESR
jgi:hypothetical protein